ncbi:MAG: IS982 family transposase [candidate division Zixibacteria bacterium]|nr:IS982 family transposase [candidate division Zixibacteria bacterium]
MYTLELLLICVYCLISEELYPSFTLRYGRTRRAGFTPSLTDEECLTIEVIGQYLGYDRQKRLFEQMKDRFGYLFPALTDRVSFVRQSANLFKVKAFIKQQMVYLLQGHNAPYHLIDTLPVPVLKLARAKGRKVFRTAPVFDFPPVTKGHCAAKAEDYFGYKGGLRLSDYGLIVKADLVQAYGHDSTCRDNLLEGTKPYSTIIGDKAFLALDWQKGCYEKDRILMLTPVKSNMKATEARKPFILPKIGSRLRRLIETVGSQLTERFHLNTMRARDPWHLLNLFYTKILAHTLCVFITIRLNRKPLDFDGLVTF